MEEPIQVTLEEIVEINRIGRKKAFMVGVIFSVLTKNVAKKAYAYIKKMAENADKNED